MKELIAKCIDGDFGGFAFDNTEESNVFSVWAGEQRIKFWNTNNRKPIDEKFVLSEIAKALMNDETEGTIDEPYAMVQVQWELIDFVPKRKAEFKDYDWSLSSLYKEAHDRLWAELVPDRGEADTIHGELIRCGSRLAYDYFNNGNCNVRDVEKLYDHEDCGHCNMGEIEYGEDDDGEPIVEICDECGGSGEIYEHYADDVTISEYYQKMFDFLHEHLYDTEAVEALEEFVTSPIKGYGDYNFDEQEEVVYNNLTDSIFHQVLNSRNKKREIVAE